MHISLTNRQVSIFNPLDKTISTSLLLDDSCAYTILFFYPADFSVVCPTELSKLEAYKHILQKNETNIYVISRDSHYTHQHRIESEQQLTGFSLYMISDRDGEIGSELPFSLINEGTKNFERATLIVDASGHIIYMQISPERVGRSIDELVRSIEAIRYVAKEAGTMCPEEWMQGSPSIRDSLHTGKAGALFSKE